MTPGVCMGGRRRNGTQDFLPARVEVRPSFMRLALSPCTAREVAITTPATGARGSLQSGAGFGARDGNGRTIEPTEGAGVPQRGRVAARDVVARPVRRRGHGAG